VRARKLLVAAGLIAVVCAAALAPHIGRTAPALGT
jgi:hypothetical protein